MVDNFERGIILDGIRWIFAKFDLFVYYRYINPIVTAFEKDCTVQIGCEVRTNMVQGVYQPGHISVQYR